LSLNAFLELYVFLEFRSAFVDQAAVLASDALVGLMLGFIDTRINLLAMLLGFLLNVIEIWHEGEVPGLVYVKRLCLIFTLANAPPKNG
jgi:hypothetical protein